MKRDINQIDRARYNRRRKKGRGTERDKREKRREIHTSYMRRYRAINHRKKGTRERDRERERGKSQKNQRERERR